VFGDPLYALPNESAFEFSARLRAEISRLRDTHTTVILGQPTPKGVLP
jgi:1-acyl-sn-glycerol-3-phosphate acyltransferase